MSSSCRFFTNQTGMSCPLCGTKVEPNVEHYCSDEDAGESEFDNEDVEEIEP